MGRISYNLYFDCKHVRYVTCDSIHEYILLRPKDTLRISGTVVADAVSCRQDPPFVDDGASTCEGSTDEDLRVPGPGTPSCHVSVDDVGTDAVWRHRTDTTFYNK